MLQRLTIQNYALIEDLDISFSDGLTIITGETGAGKSILLGALSLILGQRADTQTLLNKDKKCVIEGRFDIKKYSLKDFFIQNNLDYEHETIIRREINPEGKSRAFVNDTPVTLNQLKELGFQLVNIHSQHETLSIINPTYQLSVVDSYANNNSLLENYRFLYKEYVKRKSQLNDLIEKEKISKADLDYFQFQYKELEEASLQENEQQSLEQELEMLNNTEAIKLNLSKAFLIFNEGEVNLLNQLAQVNTLLNNISAYYSKVQNLIGRLNQSYVELKDIANEVEHYEQEVLYNSERVEEINNRLNIVYHLQQKHKVAEVKDLIRIKNDLLDKLSLITSLEEQINKQTAELNERKDELLKTALQLSNKRKNVISKVENEVKKLFIELGMSNAVLKINCEQLSGEEFTSNGVDVIRFLFSANKGIEYKELSKVASGGELARLMLAIKALVAKLIALPTLIFDEIDTGVSGEIAFKVGKLMNTIAKGHQVITITHLPQIAGSGNYHYFVFKEIINNKTFTRIKLLETEERITEIAKMLGGSKPSASIIKSAQELLSN